MVKNEKLFYFIFIIIIIYLSLIKGWKQKM